jgi:predicted RNA-binding protein with RPS1 domain
VTPRLKIGDVALGKVIELQFNGALIGFSEDGVGFLHTSEIPDSIGEGGEKSLAVGQEVLVKVIGYDRLERPALSLRRVTERDREAIEYHREAIEFRSALTNRPASVPLPDRSEDRLEWRLAAWLKTTDATLGRLRRRRGTRASQKLELD